MMFGNAASPEDFWNQSTFSFKFFSVSSVIIFIISLIVTPLSYLFIDIPSLTIFSFQIWRLFFSFFAQLPNVMSILSLLLSFLWMRTMLKVKYFITKDEESSIYKIIEVVLINVEIHLVFNIIALILGIFIENTLIVGFGWFPIILVYEFRNSSKNPEAERNLCCLPFLIKAKYFPWVILVILGLFSNQIFCFVACGIIGYFQEVLWGEMFVKLPFAFYSKLESCLPKSITNRPDFISVNQSEASLKSKCSKSFRSPFSRSENHLENDRNSNPYSEQAIGNHHISSDAGKGEAVGGGNNADFKNYWASKEENLNEKPETFEINENHTQESNKTDSDSYAAFEDGSSKLNAGEENNEGNLKDEKKKKYENKIAESFI